MIPIIKHRVLKELVCCFSIYCNIKIVIISFEAPLYQQRWRVDIYSKTITSIKDHTLCHWNGVTLREFYQNFSALKEIGLHIRIFIPPIILIQPGIIPQFMHV